MCRARRAGAHLTNEGGAAARQVVLEANRAAARVHRNNFDVLQKLRDCAHLPCEGSAAAQGSGKRRRARMGWRSRAMRREGVVVGRGGSGVEVNNGGGVGAN